MITVECPLKYKITDNNQTNYTNMILMSVFYVIKYNRIIQVADLTNDAIRTTPQTERQ